MHYHYFVCLQNEASCTGRIQIQGRGNYEWGKSEFQSVLKLLNENLDNAPLDSFQTDVNSLIKLLSNLQSAESDKLSQSVP